MNCERMKDPDLWKKLIAKAQGEPHGYALCVKGDCPLSASCLRHTVYLQNADRDERIVVVNPLKLTVDDSGGCRFFADGRHPLTYALGFMRFILRLTPEQKRRFQGRCLRTIGKTVFYEMRAGQRIILPEQQTFLRGVAKQEGLPMPERFFDCTFEAPAWGEGMGGGLVKG